MSMLAGWKYAMFCVMLLFVKDRKTDSICRSKEWDDEARKQARDHMPTSSDYICTLHVAAFGRRTMSRLGHTAPAEAATTAAAAALGGARASKKSVFMMHMHACKSEKYPIREEFTQTHAVRRRGLGRST